MTARAFAYVVIAATMLAGSAAAQQPLPAPELDLISAQRAPTPAPVRPQPARGSQPQAPQPVPSDAPPVPPAAPPPPAGIPAPRRENQSTNIRIEVTVTDERPNVAPIKKTVSIVTGDGLNGSVRSQTGYQAPGAGGGNAPFNVDVTPIILADGKIHTRLTLQYDVVPPPLTSGEQTTVTARLLGTSIRDSMALVLENGKPLVVVQSTDPVSDRK